MIVTADDYTITYGQNPVSFTATYSLATFPYSDSPQSVFGNLQFTPTDGCSGATSIDIVPPAVSNNYAPAYGSGILTTTKATLTISVNDAFIQEGESLPTSFSSTIAGLVCGDGAPAITYSVEGANIPSGPRNV